MFAESHHLPQLTPGVELGAWRIVAPCDAGGWLVESSEVAWGWLRCLRPGLGLDEALTSRFLKDPWAAGEVRHPSVPRVLDARVERGIACLVTTVPLGVPLSRWATEASLAAQVRLLSSLADVLDVAHAAEVVHRDLSLDSCVVGPDGELSVVDWGLARLRALAGLRPTFSAPERLAGRVLDARTDIYHLGAITLALVTDGAPLSERLARPLSELTRSAPSELSEVIEGCLALRPAQRFQSAREAYRALRRALALVERQDPRHSRRAMMGAPRGKDRSTALRRTAVTEAALETAPQGLRSGAPGAVVSGSGASAARFCALLQATPAADLPPVWHPPDATRARQTLDAACDGEPSAELAASREVFRVWEAALREMAHRGTGHAEVVRLLDEAFVAAQRAMDGVEVALLWDVAPFALLLDGAVVWSPGEDLGWLPYQLFADGVRVLGLSPGFTRAELTSLSECLLASQGGDPSHDFTTLLWDADLEHVVIQADDTLVSGTDLERAELARASAPWLARPKHQRAALEASWRAASKPASGSAVADSSAVPSEAAVSSESAVPSEPGSAALERVLRGEWVGAQDAEELGRLAEVLDQEGDLGVGRFAYVAAVALRQAQRSSTLHVALGWIDQAGQALTAHSPRARWELTLSVLRALGEDGLRKTARAYLLPPSALSALLRWLDAALLDAAQLEPGGVAALSGFWERLVAELDESHALPLAEHLGVAQSAELRHWLLELRAGESRESSVRSLFPGKLEQRAGGDDGT
ncbi:MAG: protein kinase [Polyangiaceae bacterium]|nr:protein kinase [Polyangiaceae bacterium]MCW5789958.1 protein kinase [Polyangiaceae bacterium]